ncbi:BTAD domain-containing putative transcriptional regulator [Nonomuraea dietziae]|uniref:BTAD domain-containing putative transcriptional regulator n=1 Tax=Nonomuraea dietziae TaxID=65515 RepID=UPI0031D66C96
MTTSRTGYSLVSDIGGRHRVRTRLLAGALGERRPAARPSLLSDALALWRGPAYADFRDFLRAPPPPPPASTNSARRRSRSRQRYGCAGRAQTASRRAGELGVRRDPLRERLRAAAGRRTCARCIRSGRQSEALARRTRAARAAADGAGSSIQDARAGRPRPPGDPWCRIRR